MNCTDSQSAPSCIAPAQNSAEVASSWCGGTYGMWKAAALDIRGFGTSILTPSNAPCPRQIKLRATTPASASLGQPNAALVTFYIGRHGRQGIEEVGVVVTENKRLACR